MKLAKVLAPALTVGVLAISLTACGGGGSSSPSGDGNGGLSGDAAANLDGRGPITYVQGKDNSNVAQPIVDKWNKLHPDQIVKLKEQTDNADQQHDDLVQNLQTKNPDYDVMSVDVIWTAEFAAKQWLQPLTGKMELKTDGFLPATVKAATYNNTLYVAPQTSDGGMLYYRKDLVPTPPKTWAEMMSMCASVAKAKGIDCYAGQFAQYEGLTVNASEAINSTGGQIIGDDGKVAIDSDKAKAGLQNLVTAYKNGDIPKQAITYQEEQGRQAFEDGKLLFLRNWPYVYNLASTDATSKVKASFGVAPLPGADGPGASTLGGHSLGVSVYSKHKATALDFLKFVTGEEIQKFYVTQASAAPVLASVYDDPELSKKLPYLSVLKTSIENAVPRPVTPFYPAVTKAIQDNAYAAIKGEKPVDQAIADIKTAMQSAGVK